MSDGGKGSAQRPVENRKRFEENFERIFGKQDKPDEQDKKEEVPAKNNHMVW